MGWTAAGNYVLDRRMCSSGSEAPIVMASRVDLKPVRLIAETPWGYSLGEAER